jgi:hypothetical protein
VSEARGAGVQIAVLDVAEESAHGPAHVSA